MKSIVTIIFLFIFSFILSSESLDLTQIQKKEKLRRKKIAKSKYILTNDKIVKYSLKKSKTFISTDVVSAPVKDEKKKTVKKEEVKGEEYWRGRMNSLNNSINQLRKNIREAQSELNRASSNFLVASIPSIQKELQDRIDDLSKQITEMRANLKQREADRDTFYREARMAGALPGWLR